MDKPYTQHLVTPFVAVENNVELGEDEQVRLIWAYLMDKPCTEHQL